MYRQNRQRIPFLQKGGGVSRTGQRINPALTQVPTPTSTSTASFGQTIPTVMSNLKIRKLQMGGAAAICAANYGSTTATDQPNRTVEAKYVCGPTEPICTGHVSNQTFGTCKAKECAANYGSTTSSDSSRSPVEARYVCDETYPKCVGYTPNVAWGKCNPCTVDGDCGTGKKCSNGKCKKECAANYGSTTSSDSSRSPVEARYVCDATYPTCVGYTPNVAWGTCNPPCTVDGDCGTDKKCSNGKCKNVCAANYGSTTATDQPNRAVEAKYTCGAAEPICTGHVSDTTWGTCNPCTVDGDCGTGKNCSNGMCTTPTPAKKAFNASCTANSECGTNLCAGESGNKFCSWGTITQRCNVDGDCNSSDLACVGNRCLRRAGGTCSNTGDCSTNLICTGTPKTCQVCTTDAQCGDGKYCNTLATSGPVCATKKPLNAVCSNGSECATNICAGAPNDKQCSSGEIAQRCNTATDCTPNTLDCVNYKCLARENATCSDDQQCSPGLFCLGTPKQCIKKPIDTLCEAESECATGLICTGTPKKCQIFVEAEAETIQIRGPAYQSSASTTGTPLTSTTPSTTPSTTTTPDLFAWWGNLSQVEKNWVIGSLSGCCLLICCVLVMVKFFGNKK